MSRRLSGELDREDFIPDAYILEVSSPGLGRILKKEKHLRASVGEKVEIRLFGPMDGRKDFSGTLEDFDQESVTILEEEGRTTLKRADMAVIRLAIDF